MDRKTGQGHLTLDELRKYLQPALSEQRENEVEAHLAKCAACARKAQTIRRLWAVADSLKVAAQPPAKARPARRAARARSASSRQVTRLRRSAREAVLAHKRR